MIKILRIVLLIALPFTALSQPVNLEVRAYAQGFYSPLAAEMVPVADPVNFPNLCDTATIVIIDSISGQGVYCEQTAFSTRGYGYVTLPSVLFNNSYLIGVRFRNTLHVVSLNTLLLDSADKSIDLTIAANLCCDFDTTYGVAAAYTGDVNLDGTIDATDLSIVFTDNSLGVTGYVVTDLNGDAIVDNLDEDIVNANGALFLFDSYANACLSTGISNINPTKLSMLAYPNPFSGKFKITLSEIYQDVEVTILDVIGKIHYSRSFRSTDLLDIDANHLLSGIYVVQVVADKKKASARLVSY
jgi:hypothetical protein